MQKRTVADRLLSVISLVLLLMASVAMISSMSISAQAGGPTRYCGLDCSSCWNAPFLCKDSNQCNCDCGLIYCDVNP